MRMRGNRQSVQSGETHCAQSPTSWLPFADRLNHFLPGPMKEDTFFIGDEVPTPRVPVEPVRAAAGAVAIPKPLAGFCLR